jgi:hypothetical protein
MRHNGGIAIPPLQKPIVIASRVGAGLPALTKAIAFFGLSFPNAFIGNPVFQYVAKISGFPFARE